MGTSLAIPTVHQAAWRMICASPTKPYCLHFPHERFQMWSSWRFVKLLPGNKLCVWVSQCLRCYWHAHSSTFSLSSKSGLTEPHFTYICSHTHSTAPEMAPLWTKFHINPFNSCYFSLEQAFMFSRGWIWLTLVPSSASRRSELQFVKYLQS